MDNNFDKLDNILSIIASKQSEESKLDPNFLFNMPTDGTNIFQHIHDNISSEPQMMAAMMVTLHWTLPI